MKIGKSQLKTFWYEDALGNEIECEVDAEGPETAEYYVTRFPLEIREVHNRRIKQKDVDACRHPRKYIKRTGGWVKGIKGRECQKCHGTQVRKWWQPWGFKWTGVGSREVFVGSTHIGKGNEDVILAMANSGDFTLSEAILAYAMACERCANAIAYKYLNGTEGYAEHSEEWDKARTVCDFCRVEAELNALNSIDVTDYSTACGECEYVAADATEENIRILKAAGFSDEEIQEAVDEDTIDLAILAFQYLGAKWFEPGVGFLMEAPDGNG